MEDHKIFFLSVVAIVAIVGIVGLIVMITGYNLPSETQAGQALLREKAITTTTATEPSEAQLLAEVESSMTEISDSLIKSAENIEALAKKETNTQTENDMITASTYLDLASKDWSSASAYLEKDFTKTSADISKASERISNANELLVKRKKENLKIVEPKGLSIAIANIVKSKEKTPGRRKALETLNSIVAKWNEELSTQVALTASAETRLPSPLLQKTQAKGKYGSLDVQPQQACVQDPSACVRKLSQIAEVDDQLSIISYDPKTKTITVSDNRGQRATLTMDGSKLSYTYFVDQEKTDSQGRQEVSFFVANEGKPRQPLTFFVDPTTLNQIFTGRTQALVGVWKTCLDDLCKAVGWDTGWCIHPGERCQDPLPGTGPNVGCKSGDICCCAFVT